MPESQGLESQRPASQRGFGIGLALVRELAEGHGGSVRVARTGPEGTVMELILPLSGSAPTTE
ncbi:MAG: ATP-binding protein [Acidipropionibacterium sp.]|nr:ATP-binding protein [Acidipropionibacterium sp.]